MGLHGSGGERSPRDVITWHVCAAGRWNTVESGSEMPLEDSVFVNVYRRFLDIQWNVTDAAELAVQSVADWLRHEDQPQAKMVCLGYHFGAPGNEVFNTAAEAGTRMLEIARYADTTPFIGTMRKRLMLDRAFDARPETTEMLDTWMRLGGELAFDESPTLRSLMSKVLMFRQVANDDMLTFAHIGKDSMSTRVMGREWSRRVMGRPADDCYSDRAYETNVCADYKPVMERDEGQFHHLRAVINVPGRGLGWYNYERLTLPWVTPKGERVLMVFSTSSQWLDIPFLSEGP